VERNHCRVDAEKWRNVYVIGDVHGCLAELETLVDRIDPAADEPLAFVGDLARKGPDSAGVEIVKFDALSPGERVRVREHFERSILPALTPLTFDPAHPFPFISNQSLSLAVLTRERPDADLTFSRVKIPRNQQRFVDVEKICDDETADDGRRFVLLEELVRNNLDLLFPDVDIVDDALFRVTRNAEVGRYEQLSPGDDPEQSIHERLMDRTREGRHCARRAGRDGADD
jgi:polyphosphate kinase